MAKRKPKELTPEQVEEIRTKDFFDCILPGTVKFFTDHYIVGDSYRCAWVIREYPPSTEEQAILSQLADRNGVTLRIYHRLVEPLEQRKIIQNATRRNKMKSTGNDMNETIEAVTDSVNQIQGIHEKVAVFEEKIEQINNIIDVVKKLANQSNLLALNASIEAARAGEAGRGFAIVAGQVKDLSANTAQSADMVVDYIDELRASLAELKDLVDSTTEHLNESNSRVQNSVQDINSMSEHMDLINDRINNIHDAVNTQTAVTQSFLNSIESMAESYEILERDCFATGDHLHSISRYVDSARGDMARGFSDLTTQDWVRIFQIDHHILTWRMYNNIAGFEHLKITQLNNWNDCKLGKWINQQTDPRITGSNQFKDVRKYHEELHHHGCDSWQAAEDGNRELALQHFDLALASYRKFYDAIESFKAYLRTIGHVDETPIKPFKN